MTVMAGMQLVVPISSDKEVKSSRTPKLEEIEGIREEGELVFDDGSLATAA